ncbi:protein yellow-like [Ctenocephalides felis]|uniref:protein yellow-like n=1 Tax=Ctenocephalides felis TaxID=7515 RepID=UPI000E6E2839|nr:protein yellow-like [Ctenocephalides felis]
MSLTGSSLVVILFVVAASCMDNLQVAYQWKQLDFDYSNESDRQAAIDSKEFIPENNIPVGLEVFGDRLFITVPRWKPGVPASLNYVKLSV